MLEFYGNFDISTPAITTPDPYIYIYIKDNIEDCSDALFSMTDCSNISLFTNSKGNEHIMMMHSNDYDELSKDSSYVIYKFDRDTYGENFKFTRMDSSTLLFYNGNKYNLEQLKISIPDNPERSVIYNENNYFVGDLQVNKNNNVAYVEVDSKPEPTKSTKFTIYMRNELGYMGPLFSELNSSTITLCTSNNDIFNMNCKDYLERTYDGFLKYEFELNNPNDYIYFNSFKYSGDFNFDGTDIKLSSIELRHDMYDSNPISVYSNDSYFKKGSYYGIEYNYGCSYFYVTSIVENIN